MKFKKGQCLDCFDNIEKPLIAGRCKTHYWQNRSSIKGSKPKDKPRKRIAKFSKKMLKELAVYRKKRSIFMASNQECQAELNSCTYVATDVHHKEGRGLKLNDESTWIAVCRSCHNIIETNPELAKKLNLSKSRLSIV